MDQPLGLRERKKARTRAAISEAAIGLFLERGYDAVSVAEIAEAAEVSKRTLFAYFATKDELILQRFADHEDEPATTVRARRPGESPLTALHRHRLDGLDRRDPITGLCDHPAVITFYRLVLETPSLAASLVRYMRRGEDSLAEALHEAVPDAGPLAARLASVQVLAVSQALSADLQQTIVAGATADALAADARAGTDLAFAQLGSGLTAYR